MAAPKAVQGSNTANTHTHTPEQPLIGNKPVKPDASNGQRAPSRALYRVEPRGLSAPRVTLVGNEPSVEWTKAPETHKQLVTALLDKLAWGQTAAALDELRQCLDIWNPVSDDDGRPPAAFLALLDAALRLRSPQERTTLRGDLARLRWKEPAYKHALTAMLDILQAVNQNDSSSFAGYAAGADGAALPVPSSSDVEEPATWSIQKAREEREKSTQPGSLLGYD